MRHNAQHHTHSRGKCGYDRHSRRQQERKAATNDFHFFGGYGTNRGYLYNQERRERLRTSLLKKMHKIMMTGYIRSISRTLTAAAAASSSSSSRQFFLASSTSSLRHCVYPLSSSSSSGHRHRRYDKPSRFFAASASSSVEDDDVGDACDDGDAEKEAIEKKKSEDNKTPSSSSSALNNNLRPTQVVKELDRHIVGQHDAKRAVAIAMRNRWRRMQLPDELRKEVTPRNVLLVGPTGCGKRRIP